MPGSIAGHGRGCCLCGGGRRGSARLDPSLGLEHGRCGRPSAPSRSPAATARHIRDFSSCAGREPRLTPVGNGHRLRGRRVACSEHETRSAQDAAHKLPGRRVTAADAAPCVIRVRSGRPVAAPFEFVLATSGRCRGAVPPTRGIYVGLRNAILTLEACAGPVCRGAGGVSVGAGLRAPGQVCARRGGRRPGLRLRAPSAGVAGLLLRHKERVRRDSYLSYSAGTCVQ